MFRRAPVPEIRADPTLKVDALCVKFGNTRILRDVSLDVSQGEYVALVGASGSGKTTLGNYALGIRNLPFPESGTVEYGGVDLYRLNEETRAKFLGRYVGYAPQLPMLDPRMTVMEGVTLPARLSRRPINTRLVRELGDVLGIADKLDMLIGPLSGGEKQRVNILGAFAPLSRLVLLDEPTSALNEEGKHAVNEALRAISEGLGRTIIVITHEETTAKRTVTMHDGCIVGDTRI